MLPLRTNALGRDSKPLSRVRGDSCGCAMGARFLAVGLVASILWYVWHFPSSNLSFWAVLLRVLVWSFVAASAGKIVGLIGWRPGVKNRQKV